MQHQALFTGVDDGAVVKLFELLCELLFFRKLCKSAEDGIIDRFCREIIGEARSHRNRILLCALRAAFTCHCFLKVDFLHGLKLSVGVKFVKVFP